MEQPVDTIERENLLESPSASPVSVEVFIISRTTLNYVIIAVTFFVLGVGVTLKGSSSLEAAKRAENQQLVAQAVAAALDARGEIVASNQQAAQSDSDTRVDVSADDDPAHGPVGAPVVVVEFSDFNCPYCGRFARETLPLLRETYDDRVRFVYRDFPILGDSSLQAAIAAECANDQGAFWEYHDSLFENQGSLNQGMFIRIARELRLDIEQFTACQNDSGTRDEVIADYAEAQRLGVSGTPTFFVNGRRVVGAQPYEVFQSAIDEELSTAEDVPASPAP